MSCSRLRLPAMVLASLAGLGCSLFPTGSSLTSPDMAEFPDMRTDPCAVAPVGRTCVTLHLGGMVGPIDTLQIDATFELGGNHVTRRAVVQGPTGGHQPPLAVPVIVTDKAAPLLEFVVVAGLAGAPVGIGTAGIEVALGQHAEVTLELTPATQSRCFDGVKDSDETDVDCGAVQCPKCGPGGICYVDEDCANAHCVYVSGSGHSRCQP